MLQTRASTVFSDNVEVNLGDLSGLASVGGSTDEQLADVDALITVLESRSATTPGRSIADLRQDIRQLNTDLEAEKAKETEAFRSRDAAWETYTTLQDKTAAVRLAVETPGVVVTPAWEASTPQKEGRHLSLMNIAIGLVLGLVVGVIVAFGVEYFRQPPDKPGTEERTVAAALEDTPGETDKV